MTARSRVSWRRTHGPSARRAPHAVSPTEAGRGTLPTPPGSHLRSSVPGDKDGQGPAQERKPPMPTAPDPTRRPQVPPDPFDPSLTRLLGADRPDPTDA